LRDEVIRAVCFSFNFPVLNGIFSFFGGGGNLAGGSELRLDSSIWLLVKANSDAEVE